MRNLTLLLITMTSLFISCSSEDNGSSGLSFAEEIIGQWQLDVILAEGADCQTIFGADVPTSYPADIEGCAVAEEILGNAKRCVNIELRTGGVGTFFWSEINDGQEDAPITYNVMDNTVEYCFEGSFCSGEFSMVGGNLQSMSELRLDQTCNAVFVLRRK